VLGSRIHHLPKVAKCSKKVTEPLKNIMARVSSLPRDGPYPLVLALASVI